MFTMELDLSADHQHLTCQNCGVVWCVVCLMREGQPVPLSPSWLAEREKLARYRTKFQVGGFSMN